MFFFQPLGLAEDSVSVPEANAIQAAMQLSRRVRAWPKSDLKLQYLEDIGWQPGDIALERLVMTGIKTVTSHLSPRWHES